MSNRQYINNNGKTAEINETKSRRMCRFFKVIVLYMKVFFKIDEIFLLLLVYNKSCGLCFDGVIRLFCLLNFY